MGIADELLENNAAYVRSFDKGALPPPPRKRLAVLTCMDARIDVHKILGLEEGDAHVLRNAGGLATDDALRSLLISQRVLGTEEVMVVHHTDCGLLQLDEDEFRREVEGETGEDLPFGLGAFSDREENLRRSLERIRRSAFLPQRSQVRGFVYDVGTGRLSEIGGD